MKIKSKDGTQGHSVRSGPQKNLSRASDGGSNIKKKAPALSQDWLQALVEMTSDWIGR